ncbi:MAG: HEAT repeat domain-containing protein [Acidobacteria bacterium]|nr:HEAT repeat domain-containing protein [Acidobacteriota bacterium]
MGFPILIEQLVAFVIVLLVTVVVVTLAFVAAAILRRKRRDAYFEQLDDLRQEVVPIVAGVLGRTVGYAQGVAALKKLGEKHQPALIEQLVMEKLPPADQMPAMTRLCEDLGLVKRWQERLAGGQARGLSGYVEKLLGVAYLDRARSAENLATIRHRASWPMLVKALDDPHPDVREVTIRGLGTLLEPQSFPALVQRLHAVILNPDDSKVAFRTVKSAVVSFPLSQAVVLEPSLRHEHRRIRFLCTDVIREMVERETEGHLEFYLDPSNFAPSLIELFLNTQSLDENPDVRARCAPVIAFMRDPRAIPVLLGLLEDSEWFVRLHTVRALAKPRFEGQLLQIAARLADPRWMVREGAVRALLGFGDAGYSVLYDYFLGSEDRYSREQIADEWQRTGVIPTLLGHYSQQPQSRERQVLEQLAHMGKTSYLVGLLLGSADAPLRKQFLQDFGRHPDRQIQSWVTWAATNETDPEVKALAQARKGEAGMGTRSR